MAANENMGLAALGATEWERSAEITGIQDWLDGYRENPPQRFAAMLHQVTDGLSPEAWACLQRLAHNLSALAKLELQKRQTAMG